MPVSAMITTVRQALNGIDLKKSPVTAFSSVCWVSCPVLPLPGPAHGRAGVVLVRRLVSAPLGWTRSNRRASMPALVVITT